MATLIPWMLMLRWVVAHRTDGREFDTLSELLATSKSDGIIKGNPLLYKECANALFDPHQSNAAHLNTSGLPAPWFWSRETTDAVTKRLPLTRRLKYTFSNEQHQTISTPSLIAYDYASSKRRAIPRHIHKWYQRLGGVDYDDRIENTDHDRGPVIETHTDALEPSPDDNNTWYVHNESF